MTYFDHIKGQDKAIAQLQAALVRPVHAYMLVGPAGCGTSEAARAFSAALLNDERALRNAHPDVTIIERDGASISVGQAREITRLAARTPVESEHKVLILEEFHLVDEAAPALLKTIEEAPASTMFVIVADSVPRTLVTVASRCVVVDFAMLTDEVIGEILLSEGADADRARVAAESAHGNLDRARLLVNDEQLAGRQAMWAELLGELDGTGYGAAAAGDRVVAALDEACQPLAERHRQERSEAEEAVKEKKFSATALKDLDSRHKREIRRLRTDELRSGLGVMARVIGKRHTSASNAFAAQQAESQLDALQTLSESLRFNPAENLALQGLFAALSRPSETTSASR